MADGDFCRRSGARPRPGRRPTTRSRRCPRTTTRRWRTRRRGRGRRDANVFFGYNYQQRKFADFWAWESQNWIMATAARPLGPGRLTLDGMFSLEPWTIGRLVYATASMDRSASTRSTTPARSSRWAARRRRSRPARAISSRRSSTSSTRTISSWGSARRTASTRPRSPTRVGADLVGSPALGPTGVHAPRVGAQQPVGAADAPLPGLDAYHARASCAAASRPGDDVRSVGVSRRGAGREPAEHRAAAARLVVGARRAGAAARGTRSSPAATCTSRSGSSRPTSRG